MQVLFVVYNFVHCYNYFLKLSFQKKETWCTCGVLHHVGGEHSWATGQCKHEPINDMENNKKYLEKGSKAMAALRKIVLDPKWLNTLHYYVRFRYLLGFWWGELLKQLCAIMLDCFLHDIVQECFQIIGLK